MKNFVKISSFLAAVLCPQLALAVGSAELYSTKSYPYGRFEARVRFAGGDGVVSAFFLWKDGSEKAGTFWNELDFEKIGADCHVQSNPLYGNPSANHTQQHALGGDLCTAFHTYTYEWTPDAIAWLVDGTEIRRETGATALAYAQNASAGMQFHFNLWPGDASFGGNFKPSILPVFQYIDWIQFSAYQDGAFTLAWREDFTAGTLPDGWLTGSWPSPKNLSTHAPENVNFVNGYAVLSLTADDALGATGAMPEGTGGTGSTSGVAGASGAPTGSSGASALGGAPAAAGSANSAAGAAVAGSGNGATMASGYKPPEVSDCSFSPSPTTTSSSWSWAIGAAALAFLRRRVRRS